MGRKYETTHEKHANLNILPYKKRADGTSYCLFLRTTARRYLFIGSGWGSLTFNHKVLLGIFGADVTDGSTLWALFLRPNILLLLDIRDYWCI